MYTTDTLLAEFDYRRDRIKDGAQHRRFRAPFVRRPASTMNDTSQTARPTVR